jgi:hypothetical protein
VRAIELLVAQAGALGTEHHRHRLMRRLGNEALDGRTHIEHAKILIALA